MTATLKRIAACAIIMFLQTVVSATNTNTTGCTYGGTCASVGDCDVSQYGQSGTCRDCVSWAVGTGGDAVGYLPFTACCGDDTQEYYNSCDAYDADTPFSDSATDDTCCDADADCVYSTVCYVTDTAQSKTTLGGAWNNDAYVVCDLSGVNEQWYDCDTSSTVCGYCDTAAGWSCTSCYVAEGETATQLPGEYSDGGTECCGDDTQEYYEYCQNYPGSSMAWTCTSSQRACCNNYDCITSSSTCKTGTADTANFGSLTYLHSGLNPGGNDNYAFCYLNGVSPQWLDCDIWHSSWCANATACGTTTGVYAGEASVGEYTDTSTLGCCGDDDDEEYLYCEDGYLVSHMDWSCTSSLYTCCIDDDNCVSPTRECVNENVVKTSLNVGGNDNVALCGTTCTWGSCDWEDCDTSAQNCSFCDATAGWSCVGTGCFVAGGETALFGEYTLGTETECCGDDTGEYYIAAGSCTGSPATCCNNAADKVLPCGKCASACTSDTYKFYILDSSGTKVASFGDGGNVVLKKTLTQSCTSEPIGKSWVIQDQDGVTKAWVNETGYMCIDGTLSQGVSPLTCTNSFIVQNSAGANKECIDRAGGSLQMAGCLTENGSP